MDGGRLREQMPSELRFGLLQWLQQLTRIALERPRHPRRVGTRFHIRSLGPPPDQTTEGFRRTSVGGCRSVHRTCVTLAEDLKRVLAVLVGNQTLDWLPE